MMLLWELSLLEAKLLLRAAMSMSGPLYGIFFLIIRIGTAPELLSVFCDFEGALKKAVEAEKVKVVWQ